MVLTEDFVLYDRHESINTVAYTGETGGECHIISQIFTSDDDELATWISEHADEKIFKISTGEKYENGSFVQCDIIERIHTLEDLYEDFDEESKEHIDAVLQ